MIFFYKIDRPELHDLPNYWGPPSWEKKARQAPLIIHNHTAWFGLNWIEVEIFFQPSTTDFSVKWHSIRLPKNPLKRSKIEYTTMCDFFLVGKLKNDEACQNCRCGSSARHTLNVSSIGFFSRFQYFLTTTIHWALFFACLHLWASTQAHRKICVQKSTEKFRQPLMHELRIDILRGFGLDFTKSIQRWNS